MEQKNNTKILIAVSIVSVGLLLTGSFEPNALNPGFYEFLILKVQDQFSDYPIDREFGFADWMPSQSSVYANVVVTHMNADGEKLYQYHGKNVVVDEGLDTLNDLVFSNDANLNGNATDGVFEWIGIGDGDTAATNADNGEETVIAGCLRILDGTIVGTSVTTGQITATISVTFSGATCASTTISETILVNSGTGAAVDAGETFARDTFTNTNVGASDTLQIDWAITVDNT